MRLYRIEEGIVVETEGVFYPLHGVQWDDAVNDDGLLDKLKKMIAHARPDTGSGNIPTGRFLPPIRGQEVWACGVTYLRSKIGRQEESRKAGGGEYYARVYDAERPELFYKASAYRTVGPGGTVRIRRDSTWNVPEPELTLVITSSGKIVGYTIGNDMSSRSIEGENPLYLPQAKVYDGCCALGPCVLVSEGPLPGNTIIRLEIRRNDSIKFEGEVSIDKMKRKPEELVSYLFRECSFPNGCLLMTGTGIIPPNDFTLERADEIRIVIEPIGILANIVG
jgi:2-dehydro-3-deoxy-D-arabinonate dehydratase